MKKAGMVLGILILLGCIGFLFVSVNAKRELKALVYEDIDMSLVEDGIFYAEAKAGPVYVKLFVTVVDNTMTDIEIIEHRNGMGSKAEVITEAMVTQNTYDVDGISGATVSSEVIKSAVSKALKDGLQVSR